MKNETIEKVKSVLNIIVITLLGTLSIIFATLYIETFSEGFIYKYALALEIASIVLIIALTVSTIVFFRLNIQVIFKICYIAIILIAVAVVGLYLFHLTGLSQKINSVEELREYIRSFGGNAVLLFVTIQFLQVVILPIPAVITVAAGTLLFGPFVGAILSFIGIFLGSVLNFFIGRFFGYKVASWIVGKESLDKALLSVKGKDKIVLTFMFLFPFFPDDILCFVAGLSTMSIPYYFIMIFITRIVSIFISSFAYNGSLIPFDTWWGILLWGLVIVITLVLTVVFYKNGVKIEEWFKKKFSKKKKNDKNKDKK